jgi:HEAT repeat protein
MSVFESERSKDGDELRRLLAESNSEGVRQRAARALGDIDDRAAVEALIVAAREDDSETVRAAAVEGLDRHGEAAIEALLAAADGDARDMLDDDLPAMRMAAAAAVGRRDHPGATSALLELVEDDHWRVRARAIRALGEIGDPRAVGAVAAAAGDERGVVRRAAATALGDLGGPEARDPLVALLDDGVASVRAAATRALGALEGVEATDELVAMLDDDAERVRRAAVYGVLDTLSTVPTERSHDLREEVVAALSAVDDAVVGALAEVLEEGRGARRRRNTAWLLGRVLEEPDEVAVAALVAALDDEDAQVGQFAATSLVAIDGRAVERELIDFLDEPADPAARARAAFALGKVGGDRARERLDALVDEAEDEQVRERAFAALSRLGRM